MSDDFRQRGGSPWGTPPGGSGGGSSEEVRGAVTIDLERVLRVRRVYIAMHLNGDIASGRPGATSYRADFRLERIDLPNL